MSTVMTRIEEACNGMFDRGGMPFKVRMHPDLMRRLISEYRPPVPSRITSISMIALQYNDIELIEDPTLDVDVLIVEE